jgi:hypothetical protein
MGILSKAWKGLKTGVKSIARGVKKAFKSFGKFMGKLGVLGQVAMFFVMPYVGAALGTAFTGVAQAASAYTGVGAGIVNAAGKVMTYASNAASTVGNTFSNITKGITDTLGNFAKTAGKKMGFTGDMFANASDNFFSAGGTGNGGMSAWEASTGSTSRFANVTEKFTTAIEQTVNESMPKVTEGQNVATGISSPAIEGLDVADNLLDPYTGTPLQSPNPNLQSITPAPENFSPVPSTIDLGTPDTRSILSRGADYVTDKVSSGVDSVIEFKDKVVADPVGTATDIIVGDDPAGKIRDTAVKTGMNKLAYGDPEAPNYTSYAAYVPSFDASSGSSQQYGAQPIMGARDFEQQVSNNASPYGYTAFQYNQYMSQYA